ncbi:Uncharacterised protein [Clostridioides difficile]|nr:Uncharacterised protein [Clostridioides difficile]
MFLIVYPIIILISMFFNSLLHEQILRFNINKLQFMVFILVYFFIFALFIYKFFIKKESFHIVSLIIGMFLIIIIQIPQVLLTISHNLFSIVYGQFQLDIFIFGTLLTLYIIILLCIIKKIIKKQEINTSYFLYYLKVYIKNFYI